MGMTWVGWLCCLLIMPLDANSEVAKVDGEKCTDVVTALRRRLDDPDRGVRARAAIVLGGCGASARSAIPQLVGLLQDKAFGVAMNAALALGKIAK
jgi:hypothetical protein